MIKAIFFDLDGTLLDTLADLTDSVNEALHLHKLPKRTNNEIQSFLGNGMSVLIEKSIAGNLELKDSVFSAFIKHYNKNARTKTKPYDGIIEVLKELKKDYQLGVITNKNHQEANDLIEYFFPDLFSLIIGSDLLRNRKPKPDMMKYCLKKLSLKSTEVLYVGDSEVDLAFGFEAKVNVIAVTYGYRSKEELLDKGGKWFVNHPHEILSLVRQLDEQFCSSCGNKLELRELRDEGFIPYCHKCNVYKFMKFSTAVSMIVVNKTETKVLFIQQYHSQRNILVAGYVDFGETLEEAVLREVKEEVNLEVVSLRFNKSEYFAKTKTLMVNFIAVVQDENFKIKENEVDFAFWVLRENALETVADHTLAKQFLVNYLNHE